MRCLKPLVLYPGQMRERSVPCGKCVACLANRRAEWCARLKIEQSYSDWSLFVTLTYAPEYLPYCPGGKPGFNKRHLQLFLKSLRKSIGVKSLRYYIISEYGDTCSLYVTKLNMTIFPMTTNQVIELLLKTKPFFNVIR